MIVNSWRARLPVWAVTLFCTSTLTFYLFILLNSGGVALLYHYITQL